MAFDATLYKETTRRQWDDAAGAWNRWSSTLATWLGPVTETMLDMSAIGNGSRVLDVAAGTGEQTLRAARRVGPSGHVLATDISSQILEYAASGARDAGLNNVKTRTLDGEKLDVPAASFDAVISRVGLIYFPNQIGALTEMHQALKPGGKVGAIVYAGAEQNKFFSIPVSIIRRRAQLPAPFPGQPGPFSLGDPEVIKQSFETAGFSQVETCTVNAPVRMSSAAECVRFERESFGALHQMMAGLSDVEREETWQEIHQALSEFENSDGFCGPCEMVVAAGTK